MRVRLPLYGKILGWFFLNLVVVAAVFVALFNAQFHFNLDWFFATGARERVEAVRDLIVADLDAAPPDDWPEVLRRYSAAHHLQFSLFDEDAGPLLGDVAGLPAAVRERMLARPPFNSNWRPPATPVPDRLADPQRRRWRGPPLRALMRTTDPVQYWLLVSARIDNPQAGEPLRAVLVARSATISAGGLIFDPKPWLWLALGVIAFSLFFWLPLIRGITRSVARMMTATRQIADGHLDVRVKMRRGDELGALGESIDEMAARLDGLVRGQKRFLADVAHELCAPVARLQMTLGILEQRAPAGQEDYVRAAAERTNQIAALVGELLSFSKASFGAVSSELRSVNVAEAVAEAVKRERTDAADVNVEVPADLFVTAHPDLLIRALANLLRNAIQHAGSAGPITLHATQRGDETTITITDCGPGVPEADLPKIFDAFYRVDASRTRETGGTGLGLAIVKTCIDSCSGTVIARNRQPSGFEVLVQLISVAG